MPKQKPSSLSSSQIKKIVENLAVTRFLDTTDPAPIGAKEDTIMGERVTRRPGSREDLDLPMLPSRAMVTKYPQRHEI